MLSKLTEMEQNAVMLTPQWFYENFSTDPSKG